MSDTKTPNATSLLFARASDEHITDETGMLPGTKPCPKTVAETIADTAYKRAVTAAIHNDHMGEVMNFRTEAKQLGGFLAREFDQITAQDFVADLVPWMQQQRHETRSGDSLTKGQAAGLTALYEKHGLAAANKVVDDAKIAASKIRKGWPAFQRILDQGAGNDPKVLERLAKLGRQRGWK